MGNVYVFFFNSEVLMTPRIIFNVIIQGINMFFAMQNPRRFSIVGCVLKPEGLRGVSKQII